MALRLPYAGGKDPPLCGDSATWGLSLYLRVWINCTLAIEEQTMPVGRGRRAGQLGEAGGQGGHRRQVVLCCR